MRAAPADGRPVKPGGRRPAASAPPPARPLRSANCLAARRAHAMLARMDQPATATPRPREGWTTLLEQANARVERRGRCLWVSVWRRPDLDTATGAALALALVDHLLERLTGPATLRSLVLDLRQAPPVNGPATQESLGRLLTACEQAGVTAGMLHGGEGLAALQLGRLVREHAPRLGRLLADPAAAEALTQLPR